MGLVNFSDPGDLLYSYRVLADHCRVARTLQGFHTGNRNLVMQSSH
jgi:hypothetical protein